jgi:UDP-N-acetylmuramate: L-alanyl-gamma-D-glutamyl-meso-diaminopimelate ligase
LSPEEVAADIRALGRPAACIPGVDGIVDRLAAACRPGDLVLIMSNGGFGGIQGKLAAALSAGGGHSFPSSSG